MLVFLQAPKRCQNGGIFRVHSDKSHTMFFFSCTLYLRQTDTNGVVHRRPGGCARQSSRGRVQYHGGGVKNKLQGYKSSMSPESQYADDRPHIRYNYLPTENSISERTRHEEKQHKANKRRLKVVYRANSIIPMEKPHK